MKVRLCLHIYFPFRPTKSFSLFPTMKWAKRYHVKEKNLGQRRRTCFLRAFLVFRRRIIQINVLLAQSIKSHAQYLMMFHKTENMLILSLWRKDSYFLVLRTYILIGIHFGKSFCFYLHGEYCKLNS